MIRMIYLYDVDLTNINTLEFKRPRSLTHLFGSVTLLSADFADMTGIIEIPKKIDTTTICPSLLLAM